MCSIHVWKHRKRSGILSWKQRHLFLHNNSAQQMTAGSLLLLMTFLHQGIQPLQRSLHALKGLCLLKRNSFNYQSNLNMAHINVDDNLPGIRSLMAFSPETAAPMGELANLLLRSNEGLSMADRELIAAHVSYLNDCFYCQQSHGAIAVCYLDGNTELVEQVKKDYANADVSDKLKALLSIAASVQKGGKFVTTQQVEAARELGATDRDIHDTVLIAAAFCMFNRY